MNPLQLFKCLADETRLRLVLLIYTEGELCVCELTAALDEIQPKVSRHLALLKKTGLLVGQRRGQWVFYRINPSLPGWVERVLGESAEANLKFLNTNRSNLQRMPDRPSACC